MDSLHNSQDLLLRLAKLEEENLRFRREIEFLKTHTSIAQGIRGETLISRAIGTATTSYAAAYDMETDDGKRIEIKFSKLNQPSKTASTRRWNWSKPLGWLDKGKDYDFLLLIGEKDDRFSDQSIDSTPYVYFLVPMSEVAAVMDSGASIGGMIQITTNLSKLRRKQSPVRLLDFQHNFEDILGRLGSVTAA